MSVFPSSGSPPAARALWRPVFRIGAWAILLAVVVILCFLGVAVYVCSNQALSMLALSKRHAAATSGTQREMFLAASEALLAIDNPGTTDPGTGFVCRTPPLDFRAVSPAVVCVDRPRVVSPLQGKIAFPAELPTALENTYAAKGGEMQRAGGQNRLRDVLH